MAPFAILCVLLNAVQCVAVTHPVIKMTQHAIAYRRDDVHMQLLQPGRDAIQGPHHILSLRCKHLGVQAGSHVGWTTARWGVRETQKERKRHKPCSVITWPESSLCSEYYCPEQRPWPYKDKKRQH